MKKILSIALAVSMLLGCAGSLAETTKHERVYITTAADGAVKSVTDNIRLENADALDEIVDATILTDLVNLSGKETFTLDGETLTWQANGKDITYQGTSEKAPAVLPLVTLTLDGEEISAEELKERTGKAALQVAYKAEGGLPAMAVTLLLLPEEGVTDLKTENATVLSEMGRQILVGWAVPGVDKDLELPDSFSATFQADHADLSWMMTFVTSDPITKVCEEVDNRVDVDAHLELDEAEALLTALRDGTAMPETTGKTKDIAPKITELNDGLTELDDGAKELADGAKELKNGTSDLNDGAKELQDGASDLNDGAKQLSDGASSLNDGAKQLADGASDLNDGAKTLSDGAVSLNDGAQTLAEGASSLNDGAAQVRDGAAQLAQGTQSLAAGMTTADTGAASLEAGLNQLVENNDSLNAGAQALFTAVLATANQQLAAAGLDAAGITLPELTAANYAAALGAALDQLNPETLSAAAAAQVEAVVRPQVEANEAQVRAAVEQAVQAKVLEAVLQAAGLNLTAEQYTQAAQAGQVTEEQAAMVSAAVAQQMETDEVKAQIEENVQAQIDELVKQNVESYLSTDETVAAQLAAAQAGYDSLSSLKDQLDQVNTFVQGVAAYTEGVAQASEGASSLKSGLDTLNEGANTLNEGAGTLAEGTSTLADGASSLKDGAATLADGASSLKDGAATLAEGTASLKDGADTLSGGAAELYDGTVELADGAGKLYDGTVELADGAGKLYDGATELADGAKTLQETGTGKLKETLLDAEKEAAEKLLPYVQDDLSKALRIFEETRDNAKHAGYDLRPEGMETVTVYIIRTDLQ